MSIRLSHVFVGLAIAVLVVACQPSGDVEVTPISADALLSSPPANALVLDVRTPAEFAAGRVPGATNVPHDELAGRLGELAGGPDRPVVVYCKSGKRAGMASDVLLTAGYTNVFHLEGDMSGWVAAGRTTEVD